MFITRGSVPVSCHMRSIRARRPETRRHASTRAPLIGCPALNPCSHQRTLSAAAGRKGVWRDCVVRGRCQQPGGEDLGLVRAVCKVRRVWCRLVRWGLTVV